MELQASVVYQGSSGLQVVLWLSSDVNRAKRAPSLSLATARPFPG